MKEEEKGGRSNKKERKGEEEGWMEGGIQEWD